MASINLGKVVGDSAYEVAVANGFVGTEEQWLASLKGATGSQGPQGPEGPEGFSPVAAVTKTGSVATITITDENGTTTASVYDGAAGASTWSDISDKPFNTVGSGLTVSDNVLSADVISTWSEIQNKPFSTVGTGLTVSNDVLSANVVTTWSEIQNKPFDTLGVGLSTTSGVLSADWEDDCYRLNINLDNLNGLTDEIKDGHTYAYIIISGRVYVLAVNSTYDPTPMVAEEWLWTSVDEYNRCIYYVRVDKNLNSETFYATSGAIPTVPATTINDIGKLLTVNSTGNGIEWAHYQETDPLFTASPAYSITATDITDWNNKFNEADTASYIADTFGMSYENNSYVNDSERVELEEGVSTYTVPDGIDQFSNASNLTLFGYVDEDAVTPNIALVAAPQDWNEDYFEGVFEGETWSIQLGGKDGPVVTIPATAFANEGIVDINLSQEVVDVTMSPLNSNYINDDIARTSQLPTPDGVTITASNGVWSATFSEADPVFSASPAATITASDISDWNAKQDALTITGGGDITVTVSDNNYTISAVAPSANTLVAGDNITITSSGGVDTISASFTFTESDPIFTASPAYSITTSDITAWNAKLDTESDPVFEASAAASITASDISAWNGKQDALTAGSNITISGNTISAAFTFTESDPVYAASPAASITASDISNWNGIVGVPSASGVSNGNVLTVSNGNAVWGYPIAGAIAHTSTDQLSYTLNDYVGFVITDTASHNTSINATMVETTSIVAPEIHAEDIYAGGEPEENPALDDEYYNLHLFDSMIEGVNHRFDEDEADWVIDKQFMLDPEGGLDVNHVNWADGRDAHIAVKSNIDDSDYPGIWMSWNEGKDGYEGTLKLDGDGNLTWNDTNVMYGGRWDNRPEEPEVGETGTVIEYSAPTRDEEPHSVEEEYEWVDSGAKAPGQADWQLMTRWSTDEYPGSAEYVTEANLDDRDTVERWGVNVSGEGIHFNHTWHEEDEENPGQIIEVTKEGGWNLEGIVLIDGETGHHMRLTISNGQIALEDLDESL